MGYSGPMKKDWIVQTLVETIKCVSDEEKEDTLRTVIRIGKRPIHISLDGTINLSQIADKIIKEKTRARDDYTFEDILERLQDILLEVHSQDIKNQKSFVTQRVEKFLSEIKKRPDQYIYLIPTTNINLFIDHFDIRNVNFIRVNDKTISELKKDFSSDEQIFQTFLNANISVLAKIPNIYAKTNRKSFEKALTILEEALNAIRVVYPWARIGIKGDFPYGSIHYIYLNKTTRNVGGGAEHRWADWLTSPLKIDDNTLEMMTKNLGLKDIQDLLSIDSPNSFQKSILTSIHWFGEAIKDEKEEDSFIKLIIALESIFIKDMGESKGEKIAERCAFLIGNSRADRIDIYKKMKKYIQTRNKIVHDGSKLDEHSELIFLRDYTRHAIAKICSLYNKYESLEKFLEELDEKKF